LIGLFSAALLGLPTQHYLKQSSDTDNDAYKTIDEICNENGFALEEYEVTTEDGYILTLFRIPGLIHEDHKNAKKPAILLQHGLGGDAVQWVINTLENSAAFILARHGYDVWLGNNRGCLFSQKHATLDPVQNAKEYWNFDFEDMGLKDLPAEIDFILKTTN
jgi:pimeloyl-ACP methyl ester carboxylesterase